MPSRPRTLLVLPPRIQDEVAGFAGQLARLQGEGHDPAALRTYLASMGVYENREAGCYMARARLGAGLAFPHQLETMADLSEHHGDGVLHITTRQDIQIHGLPFASLATIQTGLLQAGLSACGSGGNTLRNVTACPRAAFCPRAVFDVAPHAIATTEHLLHNPRAYSLPRKFKIAFSGCGEDCALASVNDLGFFAHERDGQPGFAAYAGGGLGSQPALGVKIEDFIPVSEVFAVAAAVMGLFDRLGERANRHRARLRYVLSRLGREAFVAEYRRELVALHGEKPIAPPAPRPFPAFVRGLRTPHDAPIPDGFLAEQDPARLTLNVPLHNGRISARDMRKLGRLAHELGAGLLVATQHQDLLIPGIATSRAEAAREALAQLSTGTLARQPKVIACTGARTCKLGLCRSPALADAIRGRLHGLSCAFGPQVIRISGCPNSCANHPIAALGFEGRMRKVDGQLVPVYQVFVGGKAEEGRAQFAERLGTIEEEKVPDLVAEICSRRISGTEEIRSLIQSRVDTYPPMPSKSTVEM